jgi:hypothetical protein
MCRRFDCDKSFLKSVRGNPSTGTGAQGERKLLVAFTIMIFVHPRYGLDTIYGRERFDLHEV